MEINARAARSGFCSSRGVSWVELATPLMQLAAPCQHAYANYGDQVVSVVSDPHFRCNYQLNLEVEANDC